MIYSEFIESKHVDHVDAGFDPDWSTFPSMMKPHQRDVTGWACRRGRSLLALDTGLGKTLCQLTWADQVIRNVGGRVLILAPLAVSSQTVREGDKFGIGAKLIASMDDVEGDGIYITNYEKLHHIDPSKFVGVVLDESSILKGIDGKTRKMVTSAFKTTPYRLSCTATPSPNDVMELGTQAEFLGVMSQVEMLAMFFIHDGGDTSKWRLKGHGKSRFWEWLSTWSVFITSPADLGHDGAEYDLPPVQYHNHVVDTLPTDGLFATPAQSLMERNKARRDSVDARCQLAADIVNGLDEPCIVWCHLNDESATLGKLIDGAVEVKGADKDDHKTLSARRFADRDIKALVSKPRMFGYGLNLQTSHHCVFVGLSDSWEAFYQAIRRQWRFGQTENVQVHIISADTEGAVVENIRRKDAMHKELMDSMMVHMRDLTKKEISGIQPDKTDYFPDVVMTLPSWLMQSA